MIIMTVHQAITVECGFIRIKWLLEKILSFFDGKIIYLTKVDSIRDDSYVKSQHLLYQYATLQFFSHLLVDYLLLNPVLDDYWYWYSTFPAFRDLQLLLAIKFACLYSIWCGKSIETPEFLGNCAFKKIQEYDKYNVIQMVHLG